MAKQRSDSRFIWYLEGTLDDSGELYRVPVMRQPFRVGRDQGLELSLPSQVVSSVHAQIIQRAAQLHVLDLGSTNGTFVNKILVDGETPLVDGDIVQFATLAFRVGLTGSDSLDSLVTSTASIDTQSLTKMAEDARRLQHLLAEEAVTELFQPIVSLIEGPILGYEVLGRGNLEGLPGGVLELFHLAETIGAEIELSLLLRRRSVATCGTLAGEHCYFLNTHPAELVEDVLIASLREARHLWPDLRLALEIHESAVADPTAIQRLRDQLAELEMLLVYDDFGAGQARLLQLAEVPPDFLKFDRSLIRGIHRASTARRQLLRGLVTMARELGIRLIAEGLESQGEVDVCRDLGFEYGQGDLFALPRPCEERQGALYPPEPEGAR